MRKNVILLNGPSSSGKSTLSNTLQQVIINKRNEEYGVISIDNYLKMTTDEVIYEDDVFEISSKLCGEAIDILDSKKGIIIDHVITSERIFYKITEIFKFCDIYLIHVTCPLSELIQREKQRKNRCLGSAKSSYQYLFPKNTYDLTVDTFQMSSEDCSLHINEVLKEKPKVIGIEQNNM